MRKSQNEKVSKSRIMSLAKEFKVFSAFLNAPEKEKKKKTADPKEKKNLSGRK